MNLSFNADELLAFAPELEGKLDPEDLDELILWCNEEINVDVLGQRNGDRLGLHLAAHVATMHARARVGGATGPIQSITIGPVTKTYSVAMTGVTSTAGERALAGSAYGQEYARLVKLFAPRMAVL